MVLERDNQMPQIVNGHWSCLASVLNCIGKGGVMQDRIILDMISSMDVVLEASKPPYEPFREACLKPSPR